MRTNWGRMGRGTLYLMLAHAVYLASSYAIHFGLGRYLGPEAYGTYGVVLALMTTVNLFLTTGFPQAASMHIAAGNATLSSVIRSSRRVQTLFTAIVFGLYLGLSGHIARLLGDAELTPYIRLSAAAVPFYALYAIYSDGYLNGLREFGKQSKAMAFSSIARLLAVLTLVALGFGVRGAILGYLAAAVIGWTLAWWYLGPIQRDLPSFGVGKILRFGVPATLFSAMVYLLMSVDLFAVKAFNVGEADTGYYTAAATVAKVPYFIFGALASTLLPSISRAISGGDAELTGHYIRQSMRYMLLLLTPTVLIISATSGGLISLVYSADYAETARPLEILAFGLACLTVFFVLAHVVMGSGRPHVAFGLAAAMVAIDIVMNVLLVPRYGLTGAAWATTVTGLTGMIAASVYVLARFKTLVRSLCLLRIGLAAAAVYLIASYASLSPCILPLLYAGLFILYFGMLAVMREFDDNDVETLKRMIPLVRFRRMGEQ